MELTLSENKRFLIINSCTELEYNQLKISLTKKIEGWRFNPLVKKGLWDGNISFIKRNKIPSGLWKEVIDICKEFDFEFKINDISNLFDNDINRDDFIDWAVDYFNHDDFKPRDYQLDTAFKVLKYRRCLAELATSAGKTLISFIIIAYLFEKLNRKKILYIVPNVNLVLQATGDFETYNKYNLDLKIQQIYAGVKIKKESNIVIGTYQSLVKKEESYFKQFDVIIIDEVHKGSAASIQKIMDKCWHCDYRFGLSGTVPKDGTVNKLTLMSSLGPLIVKVKANFLQKEGYISNCKVFQYELDYISDDQKISFAKLYNSREFDNQKLFALEQNYIIENENRLNYIVNMINDIDLNSLVLFHRISYGEKIFKKLKEISNKKIYYVDGSVSAELREEFKNRMENNSDVIIVASYGTFSVGLSIKRINNIFFTESFKSEVIIRQSIGRGLRKHHTKDHVRIYDFIDNFSFKYKNIDWVNYIYRHGLVRRKIYKEEQFPYEVKKIKLT